MSTDLKRFSLVCYLAGMVLLIPGLLFALSSTHYFNSSAMNLAFGVLVFVPSILLFLTAWGVRNSHSWFWLVGLSAAIFCGLVSVVMLLANWAVGVLLFALSVYLGWSLLRDNAGIRSKALRTP